MYEIENKMVVDDWWYWLERVDNIDDAELVEDLVSIDDDDRDCYEGAWGSMDKVDSDILMNLAQAKTGRKLESAVWDDQYDAIIVTYYEEIA